jgi:hypothetical protein
MVQEKRMGSIHGLNQNGEVISLAIFKAGSSIHLVGSAKSHVVDASKQGTVAGWKHEAALVWGLRDLIAIGASSIGTRAEQEQLQSLGKVASKKKRHRVGNYRRRAAVR